MRVRLILLLLIALTASGTAMFTARNWLSAQRAALAAASAERPPEPARVQVLVAKENLPTGLLVKSEHLRWQAWPDESVPGSYMVYGEVDEAGLVGTVVRVGIAAGEPITDLRLVRPGESGFLAAVLGPGLRAVTVPVDATTGISGFIFPGDRVDLILTHSIEPEEDGDRARKASETVLANVRVLAIDQTTDDQSEEPSLAKTTTLEVTPKQAEIVTLMTGIGRLSLSLRSLRREEQEPLLVAETDSDVDQTQADLLAQPPGVHQSRFTWDSEVSSLLGRQARVVQVVRGSESDEVHFDGSGGR